MNLDLAVIEMAYSEGRNFAAVQALLAKRRGDVMLAALQMKLDKPETPPAGTPITAKIDKVA